MFDELFESFEIPGRASKRGQTIARIVFGLLGFLLALAGVLHVVYSAKFAEVGLPFRLAMVNLFAFLALFCGVNIVLHRPSRWPGPAFLASLVLLILVRLVFGA